MWVEVLFVGPFANNVGLFADNVGRRGVLFANNVVPNLSCLWVERFLFAGRYTYFRGEQRKPIHERNWNNNQFDTIAKSFTGKETDYSDRIPAYSMDAYARNNLAN